MKKLSSPVVGNDVVRAASILRKGGLIAFPTETYYGLAVDPFNENALKRLFKVKNRSHLKPVLVLIDNIDHLKVLVTEIPSIFTHLIDKFWPGPLTLVFPAIVNLPSLLIGNSLTIGIRQSSNYIASNLANEFGGPITATSANKSGYKPALTANEVLLIFNSEIDMVLDGGKTPGGKGSTLIGYSFGKIQCIREGCIDFKDINTRVSGREFL